MENISVFDFDGTITTCDTLPKYLMHSFGVAGYCWGGLCNLHWLILCKLGVISNDDAKERLLRHFLRGVEYSDFENSCRSFGARYNHVILRKKALSAMQQAVSRGETVVIVSASVKNWILPFFENLDVQIIATELEIDASKKLTGSFATKNCNRYEKVRRLLQIFPQRDSYHLTVYGDSAGDAELMKIADKVYYREF